MNKSKPAAILAMAGCALLWSTAGILIKLVHWPPLAIAGMRSLIGGLLILLYLKKPKSTLSFAQLAAAVSYAATMILFVTANKLTTSANAILLQYTCPVYVAILGAFILKERVRLLDWAIIVIVIAGMVLFFFDELSTEGMTGNIIALVSGVTMALFMVFMRMQKDGSPLESIFLSHGITFLVAIPAIITAPALSASSVAGIGLLGVFQIGISGMLFSYGVKSITALETVLISTIEPILNPVWVFIFTAELPGPLSLVGGLIILIAVTIRSVIDALPRVSALRGNPR